MQYLVQLQLSHGLVSSLELVSRWPHWQLALASNERDELWASAQP